MSEPLFYTFKEAADQLRIGRTTMFTLVKDGELTAVRVRGARRIPANVLIAYRDRLIAESLADREAS